MKRWKKAALITVGIVLLLAGFVAFMLPSIVGFSACLPKERGHLQGAV